MCDQVRELVSASLDGELSELEAARVDAHIASCASCAAYASSAGRASQMLRETPLEQLTVPIVLPGRRLAVARKLQVAAAAAALVATVGLSAVVGSSSSRPVGPSGAKASKLRFPEQELRMLERAAQVRANRVTHRLAL